MTGGGLAGDMQVACGPWFPGGLDQHNDEPTPDRVAPAETIRPALERVLAQAEEIILSRHNKYGPKNIANAPGGALTGILVRLHDKLSRLAFGIQDHPDESVEDAFFDTLGYAAIALLVIRGEWPA